MSVSRGLFIQRSRLLILLVGSFLIVIRVMPIFAHAELVMAEPAPGTRLYRSPAQIRLTFGEPVAPNSTIVVFGNNFRAINGLRVLYNAATPERLAATLPSLSPSQYTGQWKAVSVDGDIVSGSYAFSVTGSLIDAVNGKEWLRGGILAILGLTLVAGIIRWHKRSKRTTQPQRRQRTSWQKTVLLQIFFSMLTLTLAACLTTNITPTPLPTVMPTATPDPVILGRQVFVRVCSVCHGENAEGYANALNAPALDETEHAYEHPDPVIHDWIVNGKLGLGRQMPALGEQLTDEEVHAVIAYLHTLWTEEQLTIQQDITSRYPATPEPTWTPGS